MKFRAINPDRGSIFARACMEASREVADDTPNLEVVPIDWIFSAFVSPRNFSALLANRASDNKSSIGNQEGKGGLEYDEWLHGFLAQISKCGEPESAFSLVLLRPSSLLVNETNSLLLSPQIMQKLLIFRHRLSDYERDGELNLEVKEAINVIPKLISNLHLSSISESRQNKELEEVALELYFSTPRYLVDGDILCIPMPSTRTKHSHDEADLEEIVYRWYLVESKGGTDVDMTSPMHTKIILSEKPSRPCLLPDVDCTSKLMCIELAFRRHELSNNYNRMVSGQCIWSQFVSGRSYAFSGFDVESLRTRPDILPDSPLSRASTSILNHLSPALELLLSSHFAGINDAYGNGSPMDVLQSIRETLSTSPLLVEGSRGKERRRRILLGCAGVLGIRLCILDARFLWEYSSNRGKFERIGAAGLFAPVGDEEDCLRSNMCFHMCTSNALEIVKRAPCLLYIEGIDELLEDVRGLRFDSEMDYPSAEASLADCLRLFFEQVHHLRPSNEEEVRVREDESRLRPYSNHHWSSSVPMPIIPIVIVESKGALAREIRELFPREVNLSPLFPTKNANEKPHEDINGTNSFERQTVVNEVAYFLGMSPTKIDLYCFPQASRATAEGAEYDDDDVDDGISDNKLESNVSPVYWADIGGLDEVRKEILDIIQLPSLRPELFPPGCPRRHAALLYGAPGTGKTLVAKAVATECGMNFVSIKGPELLDMYVGESERNVRMVFENARKHAPCVLFFDELDSLAPARGRGGDGGGVMDRVVAQLLIEMDSLSSPIPQTVVDRNMTRDSERDGDASELKQKQAGEIFVLGATNRPDLLDPALLRPGRFDRKIYLSVCRDASTRENILKAQTRRVTLEPDVDLGELSVALPHTLTGADIGFLVSRAFTNARERKLNALRLEIEQQLKPLQSATDSDKKSREDGESMVKEVAARLNRLPNHKLQIIVKKEDLLEAAENLVPSVSPSELEHYERLALEYNDLLSK